MCKRYTVKERLKMATLAKQIGVQSTANKLKVNIKTVYYWLNRYNRDLPLISKTDASLTTNDITRIIKTAMELPEISLTERLNLIEKKCSLSTIYRILVSADILMKNNRLISYYCEKCLIELKAVSVYYGIPRKLDCPHCCTNLCKATSQVLPFYYPRRGDFLIRGGKLKSITTELLVEIEPLLDIPTTGIPLLIQNTPICGKNRVHIVKNFQANHPHSFCGRSKGFNNSNVFSMVTRRIKARQLCNICMDRSIEKYNQDEDLSPKFEMDIRTNDRRKLKLLKDAACLKNVSFACKINGYSRPTYYSAKREFGDLI